MIPKKYVAAILGGSGSVGQHVLAALLVDPQCEKVILVSRRALDDLRSRDPDRIAVQVCDPLDNLADASGSLAGVHVAFCTLGHGSSRRATREDLLRVDADIPGVFARACREAGVTHYCLMTASGADEAATWGPLTKTAAGGGWYRHVKGVAERLTREAGLPYTYIAQPATLRGSPHTPKVVGMIPNFLFPLGMTSAHVADIARGMVETTVGAFQRDESGVVTIAGGVPISRGTAAGEK